LREFRDQKVRSTFAGVEFMRVFEASYYSFSPTVASTVASSQVFGVLVRFLLYPLLSILQASAIIFHVLSFAWEVGMIVSGIFGCTLLGIAYAGLPIIGIQYSLKKNYVSKLLKTPSTGVS
jgi:hypothetical protein